MSMARQSCQATAWLMNLTMETTSSLAQCRCVGPEVLEIVGSGVEI